MTGRLSAIEIPAASCRTQLQAVGSDGGEARETVNRCREMKRKTEMASEALARHEDRVRFQNGKPDPVSFQPPLWLRSRPANQAGCGGGGHAENKLACRPSPKEDCERRSLGVHETVSESALPYESFGSPRAAGGLAAVSVSRSPRVISEERRKKGKTVGTGAETRAESPGLNESGWTGEGGDAERCRNRVPRAGVRSRLFLSLSFLSIALSLCVLVRNPSERASAAAG